MYLYIYYYLGYIDLNRKKLQRDNLWLNIWVDGIKINVECTTYLKLNLYF